ncbi:demethoxyubiquinone hydroxylase family protein [Stenotrophomonas mori]|uniref:Demethoxyubiquinone hydroxylase family protein n=1 Tax=Stenotrophomonas mori TaxID=2871096 RepID=A0ABT0SEM7_9GAMM|nr:demethoxyubiquinone hydroxylase family protein [Stenotrophomonas mori]MCL7713774.1 demethoxyubiquinone hydroxylase family protein [Stenotrophomonas mori]
MEPMTRTPRTPATCGLGDRILKVDHAGEHGAVNIYSGQLFMARLTAPGMVDELREFRAHEQRHRAIFAEELRRRGRPRCRSYWLCGVGGRVLGLITGLFGSGAISATTVAVESVVLRHLEQQLALLEDDDPAAVVAISAIVAEEQQHHDCSAGHLQGDRFWPRGLSPVVAAATEAVIWLGMRS